MAQSRWASILDYFYGQWFAEARRSSVTFTAAIAAILEIARRAVAFYMPRAAPMMEAVPPWLLPSVAGVAMIGTALWTPYKIHRRIAGELETLKGAPPNLTLVGEPAIGARCRTRR